MTGIGAILAGGQSKRFGSDKADALYEGKRLIDCVADALAHCVPQIVVCGRHEPGRHCLDDRPEPGLGPLGGLAAALAFAQTIDVEYVLSSGCDTPDLPNDLLEQLRGEGPSIVESQPVIGYWPANLGPRLDAFIAEGGRSLYRFADHVGARRIALNPDVTNINQPTDLDKIAFKAKR